MGYIHTELVGDALESENLGNIIGSYQLLIDAPDFKGVKADFERQLDFLRYMFNHGCKNLDMTYDALSNKLVDYVVVKNFVRDNYHGRESVVFDSIKEGYPELFLTKSELNLN